MSKRTLRKHLKKPILRPTHNASLWISLKQEVRARVQEGQISSEDVRVVLIMNSDQDLEKVLRKLSITTFADIDREFGFK